MRTNAILSIVAATLVGGCASSPQVNGTQYQSLSTDSAALSVLKANGLVSRTHPEQSAIRDMPRSGTTQQAATSGAGSIAYAAANAITPPPGIGGGFALGMSALSLLMPGPYDPLSSPWVIAWMPKGMAGSPTEARQKMAAMLEDALHKAAVAQLEPPYRATARPIVGKPPAPWIGHVVVNGGVCDQPKISCGFEATVNNEPLPGVAPDFLGGGPAWAWPATGADNRGSGASLLAVSGYDRNHWKAHPWLPDLAVYQAMSAELPGWVFIYLAPGNQVSLGPDKGFLKTPLVLNQGQVLEFVKPAGVAVGRSVSVPDRRDQKSANCCS